MKSWKTTASGIASILPQVLHAIYPAIVTAEVANGLSAFFVAIGLVAAKDNSVKGGTSQQ